MSPPSLPSLALLFLKLGLAAFGGPAAHIAMMEEEVVRRRGWLDRQQFLDLIGAANLIPGPNSTEMAIHLGYILRGGTGLLACGLDSRAMPASHFPDKLSSHRGHEKDGQKRRCGTFSIQSSGQVLSASAV